MSTIANSMHPSETRELLVKEIEGDEFHLSPIQGKILLNDVELLLDRSSKIPLEEIKKRFFTSDWFCA